MRYGQISTLFQKISRFVQTELEHYRIDMLTEARESKRFLLYSCLFVCLFAVSVSIAQSELGMNLLGHPLLGRLASILNVLHL